MPGSIIMLLFVGFVVLCVYLYAIRYFNIMKLFHDA